MIYTSAALAYMHDADDSIPAIAMVRGDIMRLKTGEELAEVWRDAGLAYWDTAQRQGTVDAICAAIAELGYAVRGTAAQLLAGDILKDEPIPEDLPALAGTETPEGLAARVWLYWAENDCCDGREVCEGVWVLS